MSAVLLAIFNDYTIADQVRMELFHDGFPTDRVELTACCELGRAALQPDDSPHGKCVKYFRALLPSEDERDSPSSSPRVWTQARPRSLCTQGGRSKPHAPRRFCRTPAPRQSCSTIFRVRHSSTPRRGVQSRGSVTCGWRTRATRIASTARCSSVIFRSCFWDELPRTGMFSGSLAKVVAAG